MKKAFSTALSAAILLAAPGTPGWAQVARTVTAPVRTAPVGGLGVSAAAPVLAPLSAPTLAAPSLSLPTALPTLPSVSLSLPLLFFFLTLPPLPPSLLPQ